MKLPFNGGQRSQPIFPLRPARNEAPRPLTHSPAGSPQRPLLPQRAPSLPSSASPGRAPRRPRDASRPPHAAVLGRVSSQPGRHRAPRGAARGLPCPCCGAEPRSCGKPKGSGARGDTGGTPAAPLACSPGLLPPHALAPPAARGSPPPFFAGLRRGSRRGRRARTGTGCGSPRPPRRYLSGPSEASAASRGAAVWESGRLSRRASD